MIADTRVETIGRCLPPESGKFCTLFYSQASFNILKMARDGLLLPLRTALAKAKQDGQAVRSATVSVKQDSGTLKASLEVVPLKQRERRNYLVFFEPSGKVKDVAKPPPSGKAIKQRGASMSDAALREIAGLENELAEARDRLQSFEEQCEAMSTAKRQQAFRPST